MTDTETSMPTINSFYDNETSTEYAVEDTVARARAEAAQETAEDALAAAGEASGAVFETTPAWVAHRNTYRGESLGESYTDEQKAMVADGTFDDLYIGDYWTINGIKTRIIDINYDARASENHIVLMPDKPLYESKWNQNNSTAGGYLSSLVKTSGLTQALDIYEEFFGEEHILTRTVTLTNGNTPGKNSVYPYAEVSSSIDLPSLMELIGAPFSAANICDSSVSQFKAFELNQNLIHFDYEPLFMWTRDIANEANAAVVQEQGNIRSDGVSNNRGVRPVIFIK